MSSVRSNKLFWQTSTGQSTQTGSITSQSQSEEFLTEYSNNNIVSLQNPILPVDISDYTTSSPQTFLNWSAQNITLDDVREPVVDFWQQPQISLNETVLQSADNNQQLDSFLAESNANDNHEMPADLTQQQLSYEKQQMQTEMDNIRQQISELQKNTLQNTKDISKIAERIDGIVRWTHAFKEAVSSILSRQEVKE